MYKVEVLNLDIWEDRSIVNIREDRKREIWYLF